MICKHRWNVQVDPSDFLERKSLNSFVTIPTISHHSPGDISFSILPSNTFPKKISLQVTQNKVRQWVLLPFSFSNWINQPVRVLSEWRCWLNSNSSLYYVYQVQKLIQRWKLKKMFCFFGQTYQTLAFLQLIFIWTSWDKVSPFSLNWGTVGWDWMTEISSYFVLFLPIVS